MMTLHKTRKNQSRLLDLNHYYMSVQITQSHNALRQELGTQSCLYISAESQTPGLL